MGRDRRFKMASVRHYRKVIKQYLDEAGSCADPLTHETRKLFRAARAYRWAYEYDGLLRAIVFKRFACTMRSFMELTLRERSFYDAIIPPQFMAELGSVVGVLR
jgi:hypothetical protein